MQISVPSERVYQSEQLPEYDWQTYQRGFLGILNNAYNQSCNAGKPKLGQMNDIENDFVETHGTGSWQEFVRFYVREHDGHNRVRRSITAMADNLRDRVNAVGGSVEQETVRYWSRKYIWSMIANTYRGFCSERTAIERIAFELGLPYSVDGDEPAGIDGKIGDSTVQVKPETYNGLDLNDYSADYVVTYKFSDDEFVFDIPNELTPVS